MFAYLIIGFEFVVLYFVFWVVFIREPKPREIRAELWGHYENAPSYSENKQSHSDFNLFKIPKKNVWPLPSRIRRRFGRAVKLRRLQYRHRYSIIHRRCAKSNEQVAKVEWQSLPIKIDAVEDLNRQLAEKFLMVLNRTLNKFSAKIPY